MNQNKNTTSTEQVSKEVLTEGDINSIIAALIMAQTRYNTADNGGIFYDFTFESIEKQNEYARSFKEVEDKVRKLFPQQP